MKTSPLLSVKDLSVKYGAIDAVKGITFDVPPGEIVALIGANGAGKTTTLRAISGLLPFQGAIEFAGESVTGVPANKLVAKGLIHTPEARGIFLNMTVKENLELGAYLRNDKAAIEKEMNHCFELFPILKERLSAAAGTLSGGEQQMLAISRSLLSKPKLLMLDEPSLGLAPRIVQQIFEIIVRLNTDEKMTILLVEQNARMALKISHNAYVLETGKITLKGKGSELLNHPDVRSAYLGA
jgi:branched-chain amino acid transport system ATP-binding protein